MKLSAKGVSKIWALIHKDTLKSALFNNAIEFEPDDFKDCVVLPIEEARIIEHCLAFFKQHHKLYNTELKVWMLLQKRIERVEKKDESN